MGDELRQMLNDVVNSALKVHTETITANIDARLEPLTQRLDGLSERVSNVESLSSSVAELRAKFESLSAGSHHRLTAPRSSSGAASSNNPNPIIVPIPDDSMSDDMAPPAQKPRLAPPQHREPPQQSHPQPAEQPRRTTSDAEVHFVTNVSKFTKDLKSFLDLLLGQAFEFPMNIDSLTLKHSTPSKHSDILFASSAHANHFIAWVGAHPHVHDEHRNPITIRAKHSAAPRERAIGQMLGAGFTFISKLPTFPADANLQTNRRNGTLAIRRNGLAFVLFRVILPPTPGSVPTIVDGEPLPADFPGVSQVDVENVKKAANDKMMAMRF